MTGKNKCKILKEIRQMITPAQKSRGIIAFSEMSSLVLIFLHGIILPSALRGEIV